MARLKATINVSLVAAALCTGALAQTEPIHLESGTGWVPTYPPYVSEQVYVFAPDNYGRHYVEREHGRELTPYETERLYGHPKPNVGGATGLAASRDSNPNDFATGIYNPKQ